MKMETYGERVWSSNKGDLIMPKCLVLHEKDSVAVALELIKKGDELTFELPNREVGHLTASEDIPIYHKLAIKAIKLGEDVYKYGQIIGRATTEILPGKHVHTHNIVSLREDVHETGGC